MRSLLSLVGWFVAIWTAVFTVIFCGSMGYWTAKCLAYLINMKMFVRAF